MTLALALSGAALIVLGALFHVSALMSGTPAGYHRSCVLAGRIVAAGAVLVVAAGVVWGLG
jgi:hypothetical protein